MAHTLFPFDVSYSSPIPLSSRYFSRDLIFLCQFLLWKDHNNTPSYSSLIVTEFLAKHETKVIAQPPYSPDLAPCDFFLLPKLKYPLRGTRHQSIEAMKRNSLKELKAIPAEAYKKCMGNWINRWHACIGSKGAYFEGDNKNLY